jgi:hypothetical protein
MGSHEIHSSETGNKSEEPFGRAEFIFEQIEGVGEDTDTAATAAEKTTRALSFIGCKYPASPGIP